MSPSPSKSLEWCPMGSAGIGVAFLDGATDSGSGHRSALRLSGKVGALVLLVSRDYRERPKLEPL